MDAPRNLNENYSVIATQQVKLTVLIGDGQDGDPVVMLGAQVLKVGNISQLPIGTGQDLKGKVLSVKTIVNDVNPKTNHTSVSYVLEGGSIILDITNNAEITNGDGSMTYRDKFQFV